MPIDPRIALGYQPPRQPSPMNIMAQMQALQNARQENAMRQAQMENYASEVSRRNALLPAELAAAKSRAETEEAARKKGEHELEVAELDRQMDHVALVNNQAGWTAWRNGVVAKDPNYATYIPEEFTPDNKVSALSTAKTARDQIAKDLETITVSLGGTTEGITRTGKTMWSRKETMSPDAAARLTKDTDVDLQRRLAEARKAGESAAGKAPGVTSPDAARAFLASAGFDPKTGEDDVSKLIPKSTGGLLNTAGAKVAEAFNVTTSGQLALGKLASRSSKLVLDLLGGKLGAGVSNADREFMLQAVGDIGNSMLSTGKRLGAWSDLRGRMEALAKDSSGTAAPAARSPDGAAAPAAKGPRKTASGVSYTVED